MNEDLKEASTEPYWHLGQASVYRVYSRYEVPWLDSNNPASLLLLSDLLFLPPLAKPNWLPESKNGQEVKQSGLGRTWGCRNGAQHRFVLQQKLVSMPMCLPQRDWFPLPPMQRGAATEVPLADLSSEKLAIQVQEWGHGQSQGQPQLSSHDHALPRGSLALTGHGRGTWGWPFLPSAGLF